MAASRKNYREAVERVRVLRTMVVFFAASRIQARVRGVLARDAVRFYKQRKAALYLQTNLKAIRVRYVMKQRRLEVLQAALLIQKNFVRYKVTQLRRAQEMRAAAPPQETLPQETPPQETPPQETPPQETHPQETPPQ